MMQILALAIAYLLGAIPFGYLLVHWKTGADIRVSGSGNIGATNVLRTAGRAAGILTLLLDGAKGYFAVWLAGALTGHDRLWMSAAAVAVMLGHIYPVFLKFRGGKGVASFFGAFLCLTPLAVIAIFVVFVCAVALTRHISMGSILAAAMLPLAVWLIERGPVAAFLASIIAGALVIYRHRDNLERLRQGTEHVFKL